MMKSNVVCYATGASVTTSGSSTTQTAGGEIDVSVTDAGGNSGSASAFTEINDGINDNCQF